MVNNDMKRATELIASINDLKDTYFRLYPNSKGINIDINKDSISFNNCYWDEEDKLSYIANEWRDIE